MKQTARIISIYSSDTAGVCSMLYELGGMTVVHDASGCNSTYATHDEPRWYSKESMIYVSALTEHDAILGNDEKLISDVVETAQLLQPKFITLCGSPMPMLIGTDFQSAAAEIEKRTGIPALAVPTNGMNSYLKGASDALLAFLERFLPEKAEKTQNLSVNILGATPLDLSITGMLENIISLLTENGLELNASIAQNSSFEQVLNAGKAHVNLVVSACGLAAAKYLNRRFGTPYVCALPFGKEFSQLVVRELKRTAESGKNQPFPYRRSKPQKNAAAVIGESVFASSLAAACELQNREAMQVLTPEALAMDLSGEYDRVLSSEDDVETAFQLARAVIADKLYQPLSAAGNLFFAFPHEAFSGRCFRRESPNWIGRELLMRNKLC